MKFDIVIENPPFIDFRDIPKEYKDDVLEVFKE